MINIFFCLLKTGYEEDNLSLEEINDIQPENESEPDYNNNNGIGLKLTYGKKTFLFMVDLEKEAEENLIKEFSRRLEFSIDDAIISVVSPEDLILSKLFWSKFSGSELQLRDVRNIMKTVKNIDENYLKEWSKKLDLESLLKGITENE